MKLAISCVFSLPLFGIAVAAQPVVNILSFRVVPDDCGHLRLEILAAFASLDLY